MSDRLTLIPAKKLTTAEIVYRLPDYPDILQVYVWQEYDAVPDFPLLKKFLTFWQETLDGKLFSVRVSCKGGGESEISITSCVE